MSYILSLFMACLAISGMAQHAEWKYWVSCWALCGFFLLVGHFARFVSVLEGDKK